MRDVLPVLRLLGLLIMLFSVQLGWLPSNGRGATTEFLGLSVSFLNWDGFKHLLALGVRKIAFLFLHIPVELVGGKGNDEIVALLLCPAQQVYMPVMQQIEGSVGYYSFHCIDLT